MSRLSQILFGSAMAAALAAPLVARAGENDAVVTNRELPAQSATTPSGGAEPAASPSSDTYTVAQIQTGGTALSRLLDYYKLEWGKAAAPTDPNAPASRRDNFPPQPEAQPPFPFTESVAFGEPYRSVYLPVVNTGHRDRSLRTIPPH